MAKSSDQRMDLCLSCLRQQEKTLDGRASTAQAKARGSSMTQPDQRIGPTGGSRFRWSAFERQWRLPPVAHARRCPLTHMRLLLVTALLISAPAVANPFAAIPTYMDSERLSVSISRADARFVGDFVFRRSVVVQTEQDARLVFQVPVWFPEQNPEDKSVAKFWEAFGKDASHVIPTEKVIWMRPEVAADLRKVLKRAIDLKVVVGKQEVPVQVFDVFSASTQRVGVPEAWKEPGFCCVMFGFGLEPGMIREATPVTISYRQPFLRKDGQSRFFYVPIFQNLPKNVSTTDTNRYSITLTAGTDSSLATISGGEEFRVQPGQSITVRPVHYQAIRVTVTSRCSESEPAVQPRDHSDISGGYPRRSP